ncbi:hypothetical protein TWF718_006326 [Orbilia javanica]|uniref:Uncharacterized protein n=1 Tax=Orbilia javanica TaxID=47235 RepID=A0AAN8N4V4_9PEZI
MLRFFPPFPSPNPATIKSPLENVSIAPSLPSSDSSSMASSSLSPPSTPSSPSSAPTSPTDKMAGNGSIGRPRSGSRSSARRCVPPRTRIVKRDSNTTPPTSPGAGPTSPSFSAPFNQTTEPRSPTSPKRDSEKQLPEAEVSKNKGVKNHHYEDAVRIACGAWCETSGKQQQEQQGKKKTVRWEPDEE